MNGKSGKDRSIIVVLTVVGIVLGAIYAIGAAEKKGSAPEKAVAVLHPTKGNKANGVITFTQTEKGVRVTGEIKDLSPGKHGFHIHEYGDCSAPDAESAGPHFNPEDKPHGAPADEQRHVGDLGNLEADSSGRAKADMVDSKLSLSGEHSIVGRAVVVHAQPDDLASQPSGSAGARIACGVVGVAKE